MLSRIVFVAVVLMIGCKSQPEIASPAQKDSTTIIKVVPALVCCETEGYGCVGSTSCLFKINKAYKGYWVGVIQGEEVLYSLHCTPEDLDKNIELLRYQYQQSDELQRELPIIKEIKK